MKFLIVDESATMRRIIIRSLQRFGFESCVCVEAEDGLDAMERFDPSVSLLITEWNMPRVTGLELTETLRTYGAEVPVLMVTARSAREDVIRAVEAGVNGYLVKPFAPLILKEKIEQILSTS
jgi:two-component system, chemotaxis family, chemotaxis protein CheY